jgi:protocatechuate 3,4-dioxygenase beta subunit
MTASLDRRRLLRGLAGLGLAAPAAAGGPLVPTPAQTEGPFYPVTIPADHDFDLVRVQGEAARAMGTVLHLEGRVLDRRGRPLPEALVEIWQCDARGVYRHPRAPGQERADPGFQGFGRTLAGGETGFRFRTVRPVPYPGRTPHIHVAVLVPGTGRLVSQLYLAGEPANERDGLFRAIRDPAARERVLLHLVDGGAIEPGALAATVDLVLDL